MNFVVTADIHLHAYSDFAVIKDGMNSRLLDGLNVVRQMKDYCLKNDVPLIVVDGDTFQDRLNIEADVLYYVYKVFEEVEDAGIKILFNTGNHDQHDKAGTIYSTVTLNRLGKVVYEPEIFEYEDTKFYTIPFAYDVDPVKKKIKEYAKMAKADKDSYHILLLHQGVDGAYVGAYDFVMKENLTVKDMMSQHFDWVVLGHYHKFQHLNTNTIYTGSPMQLNYGERGKASGFVHFNDEFEKGYKFVPTNAPRFIEASDGELTKKWVEKYKNDFLIVKNDELNDEELHKLLDGTRHRIVRNRAKDHTQRSEIDTMMSDEEIVEQFVNESSTSLDKEKLIDIGKSALRSVR
jgi:DNA repair exonuclease SbcCD nuclease subunit